MEQTREPGNKPTHIYDQLIYNQGAKNIQWGKDSQSLQWHPYDTTLIAESEEELKSLLMKVKEKSEKLG